MKFKVGDRVRAENIRPESWSSANVPTGTTGVIREVEEESSTYLITWDQPGVRGIERMYEHEVVCISSVKYPTGTHVRILDNEYTRKNYIKDGASGSTVGKTGVIEKVDDTRFCYMVRYKDGGHDWYTQDSVERVSANRFAEGKWLVDCATKEEWDELCGMVGARPTWKSFWYEHNEGTTMLIHDGRVSSYTESKWKGWSGKEYKDYTRVPFKEKEKESYRYRFSAPNLPSIDMPGSVHPLGIDMGILEEIKPKKSFMSSILDFAKNAVLSADEKLLRKQNLKDSCGDYTSIAWELVKQKLLKDNEEYLVATAKAKDEEDKTNK